MINIMKLDFAEYGKYSAKHPNCNGPGHKAAIIPCQVSRGSFQHCIILEYLNLVCE